MSKGPSNKESHEYMAMRAAQCLGRAAKNDTENAVWEILKGSSLRWARQKRWRFRIYDFWCHELGVALEIDGPDHNKDKDRANDASDWETSAILVHRVPNDHIDAVPGMLRVFEGFETNWLYRRWRMGVLTKTQAAKVEADGSIMHRA